MGILNFMYERGYYGVVPVDCYVKGYLGSQGDMDSLIFYRDVTVSKKKRDEQGLPKTIINTNLPPPGSSSSTNFLCLCLDLNKIN